ncbi:PREDICTED: BTB/POZ domain-containing protein At2g13690-like [Camelina sativa]|uniref:BTB/POZ domain-containing protein At2g13690-like n=1 Tax=Camelina sativa TaxID=90675 RepID=A0ABM0W8F4_CAMSA|nr:PREDICTED: BTB/POZ domain-containing protein At2g13690-like [Camelina sativa]
MMTMGGDSDHRKPTNFGTGPLSRRRSWCCSFAVPPASPDALSISSRNHIQAKAQQQQRPKTGPKSVPCSPQSSKSPLNIVGRMDPRRILSPGRVSPIDSDLAIDTMQETETTREDEEEDVVVVDSAPNLRSESFRAPKIDVTVSGSVSSEGYDARLSLKGRNGGGVLVLELSSEVLAANSDVFAGLIVENKKSSSLGLKKYTCRIEVCDVENLGVFRDTVELMFEDSNGIIKKLMKMGVYRAIDVLEVANGIKFSRAVLSCLKYLEAVPWTEDEEEKLRRLLAIHNFDDAATSEILARFNSNETENVQDSLSKKLVWSITSCSDVNPRNELKSLVKGLLCKSSVYEKEQPEINKEDIYKAGKCCVDSLAKLFEEGSSGSSKKEKPLIEGISREVENINWLLEIMIDWDIAEEFVEIWGKQKRLVEMHERVSPMVRYEVSRVTGAIFIAMGKRRVQCGGEARAGLVEAWFKPMLVDFGWLQRCKKGLDMREVEEGIGQTLLTLPVKQQYQVFMEWFRCFSKHGTECPNLSKAFQIWWRRSFLRGVESSTCR